MTDEYEDDDIILSELPDDELVEQMHDDTYDGLAEEIAEGTNILLGRGWSATKVLEEALVGGMTIVGIDFRDGILFVPEVLMSANAMKAGMAILKPILAETGAKPVGKMVVGTVKGDIHDIGKNLVGMMMEGAGFEVVDLGINVEAETYIAALEESGANILGMSALLTTTMPYMKVVIDTLKERGIRDDYIVMVGGAPLNEEFGEAIGADAYCRDDHIEFQCLPAELHNRPDEIPAAVRGLIETYGGDFDRIFIGYADCGTGGLLDAELQGEEIQRIPGAHCYEFYSGSGTFEQLAGEEPGTFYLTDFLVHAFDRLVKEGLGLNRHPELMKQYFGNYRRVVYLAQRDCVKLQKMAREQADYLGLDYQYVYTGLEPLKQVLELKIT
jgi:5-methyltetrahydrofolate--homocysteine methyltransferase